MIDTPFTRKFGLKFPIALGPVPKYANGHLAAAVSEAGGLGLIGQTENAEKLAAEFASSAEVAVGCRIQCDSISDDPAKLQVALKNRPRAVYLSDGDPRSVAETLRESKVPVMCEVQTLADAQIAVEARADVLVAKGTGSADGPSPRTMFNLIPELADFIHQSADDTLLLAYGGVVDSRTLAAAIALGADGAVMATRLVVSEDSNMNESQINKAVSSGGDDVIDQEVAWGQGIGIIRDAPAVAKVLQTVSRRAELILSRTGRKIIR
ncbi:MAG: nitronate monooxygenase [Pseudomonadota bacterium]